MIVKNIHIFTGIICHVFGQIHFKVEIQKGNMALSSILRFFYKFFGLITNLFIHIRLEFLSLFEGSKLFGFAVGIFLIFGYFIIL